MPNVLFVAPYTARATMRFTHCAATERDVRLGLISHQPLEAIPESIRQHLAAHWRVDNALDSRQLEAAARALAERLGGADRLIGVLEHLQIQLAEVRERLGIPGMGVEVARNFRDKARMKTVLRNAGLPCARHHLASSAREAIEFAKTVDGALVVKPPAGAGAKATFRIDRLKQLEELLAASPPSPANPVLLEEFLTGRERTFDGAVLNGRLMWHSISHYYPTPLEVLENPWIQWCILFPREVRGPEYAGIREIGSRALEALGLETGVFHMEWFELADGRLAVSEVAARPPGAQITSLLGFSHGFDFYRAWARLMIHGEFEVPERQYASGAIFIRAQGRGQRITRIRGLDQAQAEMGELVVEVNLPEEGQPRGEGYEGDGYVLLRHPDTEVVRKALSRLVEIIRVETEE
jgi:hypothetical protein